MFTFCPLCMMNGKLGFIQKRRQKQVCSSCDHRFDLNAILISEDTLRMHIRASDGRLDYLLKELEYSIKAGVRFKRP